MKNVNISKSSPEKHLGLAISVINKFIASNSDAERIRDDLRSACYLALVDYWDDYKPELGALTTFMAFKLRAVCQRVYMNQAFPVKLQHNHVYRYEKVPGFCYGKDLKLGDIGVIEAIDAKRDVNELRAAVSSMRPIDRDVLIRYYGLFDEDACTMEDIAKQDGVTYQAVDHRLRRARYRLKRYILYGRVTKAMMCSRSDNV